MVGVLGTGRLVEVVGFGDGVRLLPERVTCDGGFCPGDGAVGTLEGTGFWFDEVVWDDGGRVSSGEVFNVVLSNGMMGLEVTVLAVVLKTWPSACSVSKGCRPVHFQHGQELNWKGS